MKVEVTDDQIQRLVDQVVDRVQSRLGGGPSRQGVETTGPRSVAATATAPRFAPRPASGNARGIFSDMDSAVRAAGEAYRALGEIPLARRGRIIDAIRDAARKHAEPLAALNVQETKMGRVASKVQKILLAADKTPGIEDLTPMAYSGDDGLTLVEPAPYGVMGVITPSTNPVSTVVNNGISLIAAGNAAVINPHPGAKQVTNEIVGILNEAIQAAGGPENLLCSMANPSIETGGALMKHPDVRLLLVTGGEGVVHAAMTSGKKVVAAGPGNPPVIVDDTANVTHAARSIVDGAAFDNTILCIAEKEVFVYENVADRLKEDMKAYGAVELGRSDAQRLLEKVLDLSAKPYPMPRREFVGRDPAVLLDAIGVAAHRDVRLVITEVDDVMHPLVQSEQLMPFVPVLRVRDLDHALAWAKQAEHGFRHSAMMHSEHVSRMSRVAREIETTIFVKNAPSYAGLGFGGEGFTTLSIAGPTGEGLTSARTFTRQRRCVLAGAFRIV